MILEQNNLFTLKKTIKNLQQKKLFTFYQKVIFNNFKTKSSFIIWFAHTSKVKHTKFRGNTIKDDDGDMVSLRDGELRITIGLLRYERGLKIYVGRYHKHSNLIINFIHTCVWTLYNTSIQNDEACNKI